MKVRICAKCGVDNTRMWFANLRGVGVLCFRCGGVNHMLFRPDPDYSGAAFVLRWELGREWPYSLE